MAAEKVEMTPAGALPLSVSEKKKKKMQARAAHPLCAVRDVLLWALFHAGIVIVTVAFSIAYTLIITSISQPPSVEVTTEAEVDMAGAFAAGMLWGAVSQAAAGALALMLPQLRRRLRLLKAYAALVAMSTVPGYSMWAGLHRMFVADDPAGCLCCFGIDSETTAVVFIQFLGVGVLGLILRGGEQKEV